MTVFAPATIARFSYSACLFFSPIELLTSFYQSLLFKFKRRVIFLLKKEVGQVQPCLGFTMKVSLLI